MGNKSPATTTTTTKNELSPEQKKLYEMAMPHAEAYASSPLQAYGGDTVAGFNPTQTAAMDAYKGAVGGIDGLGGTAAKSQEFMLSTDQLNPESNPYLSGMADTIASKGTANLLENILPKIRSGSIAAGSMYGGGSTREMLTSGTAIGDTTSGIADAQGKLYFDAYNAGLNNIARAQQLNPSVMSQQLFGADVLGAVGGQEQAMQQAMMDDAFKKWQLEQYMPFMRASEITSLVNAAPNGGVTSTATGASPKANPYMSTLGGAASGAAMGAAIPVVGAPIGALLGALAGYGSSRV